MKKFIAIAALVVLALGAAKAAERIEKDRGSACARFAWDKWEGDFASEQRDLARTLDGPGYGAVEIASGAKAIWVTYDPDRTTARSLLDRLKDSRSYGAAQLTSVVAVYKAPFGELSASAIAKGGKGTRHKGQLVVELVPADGHTLEVDKTAKPRGRFHPGVTAKAPHEQVEIDRAPGKFARSGKTESYVQGIVVKKNGEDAVINVTVNLVDKTKDGKESLHAIELPVPTVVR